MNILLINPRTGNQYTKPPLGLMSIGTVCKQAGHQVSLLDMNIDTDLKKAVDGADIVGITAMTPYIYEAMAIAAEIKTLNIPVIIGGVHATLFPQSVYLTGLFSSVIAGEGEDSALELLADLQSGEIKPIYRNNPSHYVDIPAIDYSLIGINAYRPRYPHAKQLPWTSAQTSRGCPYSCSFCTNIFGHKYRAMKPLQVALMLKGLCSDYGIKDITFYDDEFTMDRNRVIVLCEMITALKLDLTWTCEARVDMVDAELLATMKQAGCRLIYYGIESGNQHILDKLDKHIDLSRVRQVIKATICSGIEAAGYFMLGCPGETKGTMKQTVDFAQEIGLDHAQFSICSPMPGSKLFELYGKDTNWTNYQYLAGADKAICPCSLSIDELEEAVTEANELFNKE